MDFGVYACCPKVGVVGLASGVEARSEVWSSGARVSSGAVLSCQTVFATCSDRTVPNCKPLN